jgi:hypothetical protein
MLRVKVRRTPNPVNHPAQVSGPAESSRRSPQDRFEVAPSARGAHIITGPSLRPNEPRRTPPEQLFGLALTFSENAKELGSTPALFEELSNCVNEDGALDHCALSQRHGDRLVELIAQTWQQLPDDGFGPSAAQCEQLVRFLARVDAINPALVDALLPGIPGAPAELEAVNLVVDGVEGRPFAGYALFGCQHLLGTQLAPLRAFEKLGVEAKDVHLLGVPYSSNPLIAWVMQRRGYTISEGHAGSHDPPGGEVADYHAQRLPELRKHLWLATKAAVAEGKRVLVLDDGGLASVVIAQWVRERPELASLFKVVEQTTRGVTEVQALDLRWPVVDVANSLAKEFEFPHIAPAIVRALIPRLKAVGLDSPYGRRVAHVGFGRVAAECARVFRALGFGVTVVEDGSTERGRERLRQAQAEGFATTEDLREIATEADFVFGATGFPVITEEILDLLPAGAIVASGSSGELESDVGYLRARTQQVGKMGDHAFEDLLRLADALPLEGPPLEVAATWQRFEGFGGEAMFCGRSRQDWRNVFLGDDQEFIVAGKSVVLIAGGRPVNFDRRIENVPPPFIQPTRAGMLLGALQAVATSEAGLQPLAQEPQRPLLELARRVHEKHSERPLRWTELSAPWPATGAGRRIFPRTQAAKVALGIELVREAEQVFLQYQGQKFPLKGVGADVICAHRWSNGITCVVYRSDADGGEERERYVGADGRRLFEAPRRDFAARVVTDEDVVVFTANQEGICRRSLLAGEVQAQLPVLPGATARWVLEPTDASAVDGHLIEVQASPPRLRSFPLTLGRARNLPIPEGLATIQHVWGSGGQGKACVIGENHDGRTVAFRIDLERGENGPLLMLPPRARFRSVSFSEIDGRFEVVYLPAGASYLEPERLQLP